jgi:hypothetical protein
MTKEQNHDAVAAEELNAKRGVFSRMIKQLGLRASPVARPSTLKKILEINAKRRPP